MNKNNLEIKALKYINSLFLFYFFMTFLFSRSFVGIYIHNLRLGEIFIGLTFLIFLYIVFFRSNNINSTLLNKNYRIVLILIFLYFVILAVMSNSSFLSPYTYKASSYIWPTSMLFFGYYSRNVEIKKTHTYLLQAGLLLIFYISIYDVPVVVSDFVLTISDKYEPHKGSDLGLFFIIANLLISKYGRYKKFSFNFYMINLGLFLPLILYRSRGAFIGVLLFSIYELWKYIKNRNIKLVNNLPIIILFFILATYSTIVSQVKDFPEEISAEVISSSYSSLGEYRLQHYQEEYPILYIENNRIYSGDGNLNWRLWMWQDQIDYMKENNLLIKGSGFSDTLYVFSIDNTGYGNDRKGLDETNENLHNFFIQIFSRGGYIHLVLFIYFFFALIYNYLISTKKYDILFYIFPLLWISFFDSSMENAHFPLIFYYFLGNLYFKENIN